MSSQMGLETAQENGCQTDKASFGWRGPLPTFEGYFQKKTEKLNRFLWDFNVSLFLKNCWIQPGEKLVPFIIKISEVGTATSLSE